MTTHKATKAEREKILQVAIRHGARKAWLFGSFARGEASKSSDMDILVELEAGRSLLDLVAIKQDLEDLLGRPVHVVTVPALSPYLQDEIISEAQPL